MIKLAPEVFRFDKDNKKTLYRRAQAHCALQNYDDARADLDRLHELDPNNKEAKELRRQLAQGMAEATEKQKAMFKNIWAGDGGANNSESQGSS